MNYRSRLWTPQQATAVVRPIISQLIKSALNC
jgi:hypothetical protein